MRQCGSAQLLPLLLLLLLVLPLVLLLLLLVLLVLLLLRSVQCGASAGQLFGCSLE